MYTITDYLSFYKNTKEIEVHWNALDNLLCATLAYLPVDSFSGQINFSEFVRKAQNARENEKINSIAPKAYEMLDVIDGGTRYEDVTVYNFTARKDNETQFGAVTFRTANETIVAFAGTDNSRIGWLENFRLAYEYPTYTQQLAIDYLKENIKLFDNSKLYIVGHSKGGNLAMASAMELNLFNFRKVEAVYNFDGPGFKKEEFESPKYQRMSKKLVNIVPSTSVIGMLLHNNNYTVVKTAGVGFSHIPTMWSVFGEFFVEAKLSKLSKQVNENSTTGIEGVDIGTRREAFESIFESFEGEHKKDFNFSFNNIIKAIKNMQNLDPKVADSIGEIIDVMININRP